MTEKRFWYDFEDCTGAKIVDFKEDKEYSLETIGDFRAIEELLNMLHEENKKLDEKYICEFSLRETLQQELQRVENENEQLKTQLQNTSDQRDEFYRGARENANRVGKLEKENE